MGKIQIKHFLLINKERERFLETEIIVNLRNIFSLRFWGKSSKHKNQNTTRTLELFSLYLKTRAKPSIDQKPVQVFQKHCKAQNLYQIEG